jgi:hypothetical protein
MTPIHPQEAHMNRNFPSRLAACTLAVVTLALGACTGSRATSSNDQANAPRHATGHASCFDPRMARGFAPAMHFKGDPISGRVCGRFGESVSWTHHECQIQRVDWITPEEHEALLHPAKAEGTPSPVH